MKSFKRFLIGFVAVYVVIGLGLNLLWGPPGFSSEFLEEHKAEVDRRLEIVKSNAYKLWKENPGLNPADEVLTDDIAFLEAFEGTPAFRAEMARRTRYDFTTDVFNVIALAILTWVAARGPVANLIATMANTERERIETIEQQRSDAARRKSEAEKGLANLSDEREEVIQRMDARIEEETHRIEESTAEAIERARREAEDRKRHEEALADQKLKESLVDAAIEVLVERYAAETGGTANTALIERFVDDLGDRK